MTATTGLSGQGMGVWVALAFLLAGVVSAVVMIFCVVAGAAALTVAWAGGGGFIAVATLGLATLSLLRPP